MPPPRPPPTPPPPPPPRAPPPPPPPHSIHHSKLAFADREAYYADPDYVDVPLDTLLSDAYNDARRKLIDPKRAAAGLVPGVAKPLPVGAADSAAGDGGAVVDGAADGSCFLGASVKAKYTEATVAARTAKLEADNAALKARLAAALKALETPAPGSGGGGGVSASGAAGEGWRREPDEHYARPPPKVGEDTPEWMKDTVHLCCADRHGNLVSIIPSGPCRAMLC
eukprot:SAG22_NODE_860_length_6828_cov_5.663100_2_plen_225_part_00